MNVLRANLGQFPESCVAEKLDDVIKTSRVWHIRLYDWKQFVQVSIEHTATHHPLTSMYQVHIAFQCVDLSIVSYEPRPHTHTVVYCSDYHVGFNQRS